MMITYALTPIPRLHDQANIERAIIEQTSSKCIQDTRARRVL